MDQTETLLIIEDNPGDARLLREMLHRQGASRLDVVEVETMAAAEEYTANHTVSAIFLDLGLPDSSGIEAVRRAHASAPHVPLVVVTGLDDDTLAAEALHQGAQDYIVKGQIEEQVLTRTLRDATERKSMEETLALEKEQLGPHFAYSTAVTTTSRRSVTASPTTSRSRFGRLRDSAQSW
jgi:PleD family two-component response regulator